MIASAKIPARARAVSRVGLPTSVGNLQQKNIQSLAALRVDHPQTLNVSYHLEHGHRSDDDWRVLEDGHRRHDDRRTGRYLKHGHWSDDDGRALEDGHRRHDDRRTGRYLKHGHWSDDHGRALEDGHRGHDHW